MMNIPKPPRGQVLPIVLACLLILTIFVPLMVFYTQRDASWAVKQAANTHAFHLAEAGVEKSYLYISQSTNTWIALMNGTAQTGYKFDTSYSDVNGGTYSVSITSGPGTQQVTVVSIGRDNLKRETRALKVIYGNSVYGAVAIYAGAGAQIGGGVNVEWGGIMSPYTVDSAGRAHPQFWSASQILPFDSNPSPPNCDSPNCVQWHSYYPSIPPAPTIDFNTYRSSAAANTTGGCSSNASVATPAGSCYYAGSVTNWNETTTGTIFIEGDLTIKSPGMYHNGALVVMGNVNLPNGVWGKGSSGMTMPPDAWKQYGNDWSYYRSNFDAAAPATYPGLTGTYTTPSACNPTGCTSSKLAVNGMLYVGGNFNNGGGGGGNSDIYGALYVIGSATQTAASGVTFYYNAAASTGLLTTTISLSRISWQDASYGWPAALP